MIGGDSLNSLENLAEMKSVYIPQPLGDNIKSLPGAEQPLRGKLNLQRVDIVLRPHTCPLPEKAAEVIFAQIAHSRHISNRPPSIGRMAQFLEKPVNSTETASLKDIFLFPVKVVKKLLKGSVGFKLPRIGWIESFLNNRQQTPAFTDADDSVIYNPPTKKEIGHRAVKTDKILDKRGTLSSVILYKTGSGDYPLSGGKISDRFSRSPVPPLTLDKMADTVVGELTGDNCILRFIDNSPLKMGDAETALTVNIPFSRLLGVKKSFSVVDFDIFHGVFLHPLTGKIKLEYVQWRI